MKINLSLWLINESLKNFAYLSDVKTRKTVDFMIILCRGNLSPNDFTSIFYLKYADLEDKNMGIITCGKIS
jgi:hypothetical protein